MKVDEIISNARDSLTVKRVYGEPLEKDGVTIVPAAAVSGGAGAGFGHDEKGQEGEGGGFGIAARPAGAYVIKGTDVRWRPAVDVNRLVTAVALVAFVFVLRRPRRKPRS